MIRRLRQQRSIAGILSLALLAYALLVPIAEARLIGMGHGETPVAADQADCHSMANDENSSSHDPQTPPCCQVGSCICVLVSATMALPGATVTRLIPVHDPARSFNSSLHPSAFIELPLRPPDA